MKVPNTISSAVLSSEINVSFLPTELGVKRMKIYIYIHDTELEKRECALPPPFCSIGPSEDWMTSTHTGKG